MPEPAGADDKNRLHIPDPEDPMMKGPVKQDSDSADPESDAEVLNATLAAPKIREGSPFRIDPEGIDDLATSPFVEPPAEVPEAFYDVGSARYMALGAVLAACVVMVFAIFSLIWFPGGGLVVAGLGCLLGIMGLFSPRPKSAGGLLLCHFGLFIACYVRTIVG